MLSHITYKQKKHKPLLVKEGITSTSAYQPALNKLVRDAKKDYGIFFTPEHVVDFMVSLIDTSRFINKQNINILEPACGLAQFLIGIKRNHAALYRRAQSVGVEVNEDIITYSNNLKILNEIKLIHSDYLLWESEQNFELIIGNPPYGIPSSSSHYSIKIDAATKEKYKDIYDTWHGKYNMYGAFIEKSIKLLKPDGQLIFIVPATFMILDDFKKLRTFLAQSGRTNLIYLGPNVFKPEADVAAVVIDFAKSNIHGGLKLLEYRNNKIFLIKGMPHWRGEIVKFETDYTAQIENICSYLLGDVYDMKVSPRTPEIKNNPCIVQTKPLNGSHLPLLNGKNLKCNRIIYDNLTGYWIKKSDAKKLRGYFTEPHIVVGLGFRENGKVGAALDKKCYPWMGDIYHLLRKDGLFNNSFDLDNGEILEYLNSDYLRRYIADAYREITYHLSITQLKNIPLPTKEEWKIIKTDNIHAQRTH